MNHCKTQEQWRGKPERGFPSKKGGKKNARRDDKTIWEENESFSGGVTNKKKTLVVGKKKERQETKSLKTTRVSIVVQNTGEKTNESAGSEKRRGVHGQWARTTKENKKTVR